MTVTVDWWVWPSSMKDTPTLISRVHYAAIVVLQLLNTSISH